MEKIQKAATMRHAQETFAAWKAVSDRMKTLESALQQHGASRDAAVAGDRELQDLRLESERLLAIAQQTLLTIKTPRSSNGDSTWG